MVLIHFLKKDESKKHGLYIVHSFDPFFEKAWTIVHGFHPFSEKSMDYSSWF